jgi:uncharacterized protein YqeY
MKLKEKIQEDFILAMKSKNVQEKSVLSGLKAKITNAEKDNGNQELSDNDVIAVVATAINQRAQSFTEFEKGGRFDLSLLEHEEMVILSRYMPPQLSESDMRTELLKIIREFDSLSITSAVLTGKTMGAFNKKFKGRFDNDVMKEILKSLV